MWRQRRYPHRPQEDGLLLCRRSLWDFPALHASKLCAENHQISCLDVGRCSWARGESKAEPFMSMMFKAI